MLLNTTTLPSCLKGRLEFGNRDQIKALAEIERQIIAQEERTRAINEGELKQFDVTITYTGYKEITVWAISAMEAEEIARDEDCSEPDELEIDYVRAVELKSKSLPTNVICQK